jgi:carbon storage regulator
MLVLSRKKGDSLVIDGKIRIHVIEVKGDSIRLGIDAPKEIPVHRHEVFELIESGRMPAREEGPYDQLRRPALAAATARLDRSVRFDGPSRSQGPMRREVG